MERTPEEMAQILPEPIREIEPPTPNPSDTADTTPDEDDTEEEKRDRTLLTEPELW